MYNQIIGSFVKGKVDRPIGSAHPEYTNTIYPINYGYIESITVNDEEITEGIIAGDGKAQDAYILGTDKAVEVFEGRVIAVYHRYDDNEDKWIVSVDGKDYSDEEILKNIHFQEKYFVGSLFRKKE